VHTVGVCGVILNDANAVLLVRTAKAGWELPGGRVESGEELLSALRREVLEETGHSLTSVDRLTGVYSHISSDTLLLVFRATTEENVAVPSDDEDVLECSWFPATEALRRVTHASERDRLADGLAEGANVAYRVYG
jgi:8-oxo-dGTP diphosphatase